MCRLVICPLVYVLPPPPHTHTHKSPRLPITPLQPKHVSTQCNDRHSLSSQAEYTGRAQKTSQTCFIVSSVVEAITVVCSALFIRTPPARLLSFVPYPPSLFLLNLVWCFTHRLNNAADLKCPCAFTAAHILTDLFTPVKNVI